MQVIDPRQIKDLEDAIYRVDPELIASVVCGILEDTYPYHDLEGDELSFDEFLGDIISNMEDYHG